MSYFSPDTVIETYERVNVKDIVTSCIYSTCTNIECIEHTWKVYINISFSSDQLVWIDFFKIDMYD